MSARVLVTGGAGFIGSHLCERLLQRQDEVICLDNFDDFYDPRIKRRNIEKLTSEDRFRLIEGDIRDGELLQHLGGNLAIDKVVHLAALTGVRPSIQRPGMYSDVNLLGTTRLLEMVRDQEISNFVFASSSSVYGERDQIPFSESDPVDHPVSPYAATKKAGELVCHSFHSLFDIDITCLRYFTVYGPRQRPEMAIHRFTSLIDSDQPVPLYGDGNSKRDYTYVDDIVDGTIRALDSNAGYKIYNLGNHQMVSLSKLVEGIGKALGKTPRIERLPEQPGDVSITCADLTRSGEGLAYQPRVGLEKGLSLFVDWYRQQGIPRPEEDRTGVLEGSI